jgi:hypothetical protein
MKKRASSAVLEKPVVIDLEAASDRELRDAFEEVMRGV